MYVFQNRGRRKRRRTGDSISGGGGKNNDGGGIVERSTKWMDGSSRGKGRRDRLKKCANG